MITDISLTPTPEAGGNNGQRSEGEHGHNEPLGRVHERESDAEGNSFPQLRNSASDSPVLKTAKAQSEGEDEEPTVADSFLRSSSPKSIAHRNNGAQHEEERDEGTARMHRFSLYETSSRYYLVGGDTTDRRFRILKINRTTECGDLDIAEDEIVYTKKEMNQLLNTVDDGNKASGGLKLRCSTWGLLGFIKFTGTYYMLVITKRSQVAVMGGHFVYQIDGTELISLSTPSSFRFRNLDAEEARHVGILNNIDLSRSFYFSYSYDITRTLQDNILRERLALRKGQTSAHFREHNSMFMWNHHLLRPALKVVRKPYDWCLSLVHGFVDQATLSVYGRTIYITLIARRSRFFAGARFLKRGANDSGYVANDVETEQIVSEMQTTSFHAPGPEMYANPNYTSYVQHRGSVPLYWTQDHSGVSPKPGIELNLVDPFYSAAALHFDDLFHRYGTPIFALNLVKARERTPRESILLEEYTNAVKYLNQLLPEDRQIQYKAWDMSRASKSRDQDVIGTLESIAEEVVSSTGLFRNGSGQPELTMQNGVARTNCIDCLDRTNAAQFVIGKQALGRQLHALGVIDDIFINYDTDALNLFTEMFHDHGDTIAIQYGGSHLVNTMETYRKINQWTSQSRDMVESFKRYYNNSFLDKQRQEAYNLFLGNYEHMRGQPFLWDLSTDYYLHHVHPQGWSSKNRKSYTKWYSPQHLEKRRMPAALQPQIPPSGGKLAFYDDYWLEYYRPVTLSSFSKIFSYKMNSTLRYVPLKSTKEGKYDLSPFRVRDGQEQSSPEKLDTRKEALPRASPMSPVDEKAVMPSTELLQAKDVSQPGWLHSQRSGLHSTQRSASQDLFSANRPNSPIEKPQSIQKPSKDKTASVQWTLDQFVTHSLSPSVTEAEAHEYQRYINHPLILPLVVSMDIPPASNPDLSKYVENITIEKLTNMQSVGDIMTEYTDFLEIGEDPLTVTEADTSKKRYKAYRQWIKGKSLFKQRVEA